MTIRSPRAGNPWGVYGLALHGRRLPATGGADERWPAVRVDVVVPGQPAPRGRVGLHVHRGAYALCGGHGSVRLTRRPLAIALHLPATPATDELLHPYLSLGAAAVNYWLGREPFHAGAVAGGSGAWMVAGGSGAGKSTLLAALAIAGADVLSDDLVVGDATGVFAGPRAIDLRPDAAGPLGLSGRTVAARGGSRCRLPLAAVPGPRPLAGWIDLAWGREVTLRRLDPDERLRRLARRRTFPAKLPVGDDLLDLVALPGYVLTRPRRFDALATAVAAVLDLTGQKLASPPGMPVCCVSPDTVPRSVTRGGW